MKWTITLFKLGPSRAHSDIKKYENATVDSKPLKTPFLFSSKWKIHYVLVISEHGVSI